MTPVQTRLLLRALCERILWETRAPEKPFSRTPVKVRAKRVKR